MRSTQLLRLQAYTHCAQLKTCCRIGGWNHHSGHRAIIFCDNCTQDLLSCFWSLVSWQGKCMRHGFTLRCTFLLLLPYHLGLNIWPAWPQLQRFSACQSGFTTKGSTCSKCPCTIIIICDQHSYYDCKHTHTVFEKAFCKETMASMVTISPWLYQSIKTKNKTTSKNHPSYEKVPPSYLLPLPDLNFHMPNWIPHFLGNVSNSIQPKVTALDLGFLRWSNSTSRRSFEGTTHHTVSTKNCHQKRPTPRKTKKKNGCELCFFLGCSFFGWFSLWILLFTNYLYFWGWCSCNLVCLMWQVFNLGAQCHPANHSNYIDGNLITLQKISNTSAV